MIPNILKNLIETGPRNRMSLYSFPDGQISEDLTVGHFTDILNLYKL